MQLSTALCAQSLTGEGTEISFWELWSHESVQKRLCVLGNFQAQVLLVLWWRMRLFWSFRWLFVHPFLSPSVRLSVSLPVCGPMFSGIFISDSEKSSPKWVDDVLMLYLKASRLIQGFSELQCRPTVLASDGQTDRCFLLTFTGKCRKWKKKELSCQKKMQCCH